MEAQNWLPPIVGQSIRPRRHVKMNGRWRRGLRQRQGNGSAGRGCAVELPRYVAAAERFDVAAERYTTELVEIDNARARSGRPPLTAHQVRAMLSKLAQLL